MMWTKRRYSAKYLLFQNITQGCHKLVIWKFQRIHYNWDKNVDIEYEVHNDNHGIKLVFLICFSLFYLYHEYPSEIQPFFPFTISLCHQEEAHQVGQGPTAHSNIHIPQPSPSLFVALKDFLRWCATSCQPSLRTLQVSGDQSPAMGTTQTWNSWWSAC